MERKEVEVRRKESKKEENIHKVIESVGYIFIATDLYL